MISAGAGIKRRGIHGILPSLNIVLGGKVIEYSLSIAYIIAGALLGAPPGREFFAGVQAANQVRYWAAMSQNCECKKPTVISIHL